MKVTDRAEDVVLMRSPYGSMRCAKCVVVPGCSALSVNGKALRLAIVLIVVSGLARVRINRNARLEQADHERVDSVIHAGTLKADFL